MLSRTFLPLRSMGPSLPLSYATSPMATTGLLRQHIRYGSMKVKRIQKKQPLEKNKMRKLIKGTKLEVKKERKKKSERNTDPYAYIDVKPVEFDPYDLRGRSTLKVIKVPRLVHSR